MKALVLAGGVGSRLRPLTHTSPKQLLPIANKPVLFYGLESVRDAGIREVGIVIGGASAPAIRAEVGDGSAFGLAVTYLHQHEPRGLAHAVGIARDYLGADDFLMYLGDNFLFGGIGELIERFRTDRPSAQVMLTKVPDPRAFGVAELDGDGHIVGVVEKPREPRSDLAVIGVYVFSQAVHGAIARLTPSWRGELEITDAIARLIADGQPVGATVTSEYWRDTGTVGDILELNQFVLDSISTSVAGEVDAASDLSGAVIVAPGAVVTGSQIIGPVSLGPGAVVRNSRLGPYTSVGAGCTVIDSEIERSIMLPGAQIEGVVRIDHSLIGRDTRVTAADTPRFHRLVLGDHSTVQVG
ncbi:MAG: glucose-1-phosphate thymidylyltransferase [Actinophytocola sp.]|uniref:glucose-1-phosphate thymidylyltransferase n=1 Tax=Actinophytocola sp. TaxID=1872138 RepID=UPI003C732593